MVSVNGLSAGMPGWQRCGVRVAQPAREGPAPLCRVSPSKGLL